MTQQPNFSSFAQFIFGLRVLYGFLITGLVGIAVVALMVEVEPKEDSVEQILFMVALGLSFFTVVPAMAFHGQFLRRHLERAADRPLTAGLQIILSHKILVAALVEGPGLFWIVIGLVTGNRLYIIGGAACILCLLVLFPSPGGIESLLEMDEEAIDRELAESGVVEGGS